MSKLTLEDYDEVCRLKNESDERFSNGDKNYASYDIRTEFWYNCEDGLPNKEEQLWEDLCEESVFWGPDENEAGKLFMASEDLS